MSKSHRRRRLSPSGSHRLSKLSAGLALAVGSFATTAVPAVAAGQPTLVVGVLGSGVVQSQPAGIACPPKCSASFPAGAKVVLTVKPRGGSSFLRWGGACTGVGQCSVKVNSLVSVAAQFVAGAKPQAQPATKTVAVPGSYTAGGASLVYGNFSLFVAPSGTKLLNVSVPVSGYAMGCTPSGQFPGPMPIVIPAVPIKANGAFSAAVSVPGVFDNAKANFKYSFAGRFATATSAGPPTAAGTLREDIVFQANGVTENCTSKLRSWTATHDPQPAPAKTSAEPGSYTASGASLVYGGFSFSVAAGGTKLLNVSVPISGYAMGCAPGGSFPAPSSIIIPQVAVKPDGSFAATVSNNAPYDSTTAKFTYSFAGNFEGATPAGAETVAGSLREDIVFAANGAAETCTSNLRPWTAVRNS